MLPTTEHEAEEAPAEKVHTFSSLGPQHACQQQDQSSPTGHVVEAMTDMRGYLVYHELVQGMRLSQFER